MKNEILSVGIDIGTTTTQVIFSRLSIQNIASSFLVPEIKITDKKVIYKSKIYFTPLLDNEKINLEKLKEIIVKEYEAACIDKEKIHSGAIIITGESSRKENSQEVLSVLSDFAGDFVVATAGPDLEGILAGYGAGAAECSKNLTSKVINYDIGGGTTNAAMFWDGEAIDAFALDIGGRVVRFDDKGKVSYVSEKIKRLLKYLNVDLTLGAAAELQDLRIIADSFADILFKVNENINLKEEERKLFIDHTPGDFKPEVCMFSGGVAEYIYSEEELVTLEDVMKFGDIGPLLGNSIKNIFKQGEVKIIEPKEKIRATVIGAGAHSIKLSGSTIVFEEDILPLKNIPIIKLFKNIEKYEKIYEMIVEKIKLYNEEIVAISFAGPKAPTYIQIKAMAQHIVRALENRKVPIIIIVENDFAKALGQAINNIVKGNKKVVCIDKISVGNGDYVDIGKPIGNIVPVVVKTLIFTN